MNRIEIKALINGTKNKETKMGEPIITTGQFSLAALLVGLVTILINHLLTNTRSQKDKRSNVGRKVIDAFRPELDALIQTGEDARFFMTSEAFRKHEAVIREFMSYLSWLDRFRMRQAWGNLAYHKKDKKRQTPFYEQYADCGSLDKRRKMRPLAISRIQKIASIARK